MMVLQLLFVYFIMPETKGISLEELGRSLGRARKPKIGAVADREKSIGK